MNQLHFTTTLTERKRGQHLKFEDRCNIKVYKKLGYSLRSIANILNCSPSTVLNELRRENHVHNTKGRKKEYSPKRAHKQYLLNRANSHRKYKITNDNPFIQWMVSIIKTKKWSFDACVGFAKKNKLFSSDMIPSTKTLYNALWDKRLDLSPFDIPEALSRKKRKSPKRKNKRILGRSIDERPCTLSLQKEYGHWEIDTVIGRKSAKDSVVLTLIEKKSKYYIAIKIPSKTSEAVYDAFKNLRDEYGENHFAKIFKTITSDNGREFESLSKIESFGCKVYFAHPYSSWERAQNERANRIFRRSVPKGVSIDKYTYEDILSFADDMNALPRKHLGYSTPEMLFDKFLDEEYSTFNTSTT